MQFKHKLIYFALGCAFVTISQVLLHFVAPKVVAQDKKMSAEFDKITCRSLNVVDEVGKAVIILHPGGVDPEELLFFDGTRRGIFIGNAMGTYGIVVSSDNGKATYIQGDKMQTTYGAIPNVVISSENEKLPGKDIFIGGAIHLFSKLEGCTSICASSEGGFLILSGKDGKTYYINQNGGMVLNKDGNKTR